MTTIWVLVFIGVLGTDIELPNSTVGYKTIGECRYADIQMRLFLLEENPKQPIALKVLGCVEVNIK